MSYKGVRTKSVVIFVGKPQVQAGCDLLQNCAKTLGRNVGFCLVLLLLSLNSGCKSSSNVSVSTPSNSGSNPSSKPPSAPVSSPEPSPKTPRHLALPKTMSPALFCPSYARVVCRKLYTCASKEEIAANAQQLKFEDETTCIPALERFCGGFMLAGVKKSVADRRAIWDAEGFGTCFQQWQQLGCEEPLGDLPDKPICRNASRGTVPTGQPCFTAFDCADIPARQSTCVFDNEGPGTCQLLKEQNDPCQTSNECRFELRCRQERCLPPGKHHEPCSFADDCAQGFTCDLDHEICITPPQ